jgi:hypothetical protein
MNIDPIKELRRYIDKQINPSLDDIKGLGEASRKHVQKLVYTNLVDRFDVMVDHMVMENCRSESIFSSLSNHLNESISESYLINLLMDSENIQDVIDERLKDVARTNILRKRHSQKLDFLLKSFDLSEYTKAKPQVQVGNGKIVQSAKPSTAKHVKVPNTVCAYADWLYARRNGVVHGSTGSKFLKNDLAQLKKLYKFDCPKTFRMQMGAITNSVNYYLCICDLLEESNGS